MPLSLFLDLLLSSCLCVSSFRVRQPQHPPLPFSTHFPIVPHPGTHIAQRADQGIFPAKKVLCPGGILLPATKRINFFYALNKESRNNYAYLTRCLLELDEVMYLPAHGLSKAFSKGYFPPLLILPLRAEQREKLRHILRWG